jgi:hypothetical protein
LSLHNGRGPPGPRNPKAADVGSVHGPSEYKINSTRNLHHGESQRKPSDWRSFYDNAQGNIDAAIQAVYGALGSGLIDDDEAAAIDASLRSQQAKIAKKPAGPAPLKSVSLVRKYKPRRYQGSPDRRASRGRRRMLARGGHMPPDVRTHYTEGESSALTVIAGEVKDHGFCDFPIDKIAALAGVCRSTVQNAIREASKLGYITVEQRPVAGRKNLTNVIRIVSSEWVAWLKRGRAIGFKSFPPKILSPTKREESQQRRATPVPWEPHQGIREKPRWGLWRGESHVM